MVLNQRWFAGLVIMVGLVLLAMPPLAPSQENDSYDPTAEAVEYISKMKVTEGDWPQWGGSPSRNNTPTDQKLPMSWDIETGENVRWWAKLGSQSYGNPVIANGKVFVGTNNGSGYLKRYPSKVDLGVLLSFQEKDGKFLWQHSSEKLPTGRVHDWENQGICSTVYCEDSRVWFVTSRGEVRCVDVEGFHDKENDGPYKKEINENPDESDVIWVYNMMVELKVSQHNMCSCSLTAVGDLLFVNTSNGVDEGHKDLPQPEAPSFFVMNKNTGKVLWTDNTPGKNVLHGQWSSPCYGVFEGVPQVIFGAGDGWIYSFAPEGDGNGNPKMLWKFDCNPKTSVYKLYKATRNHIIGTPIVYDGKVFVAVGEDPEHASGEGHLWCIDPTKRGDISPELVFNSKDPNKPIAHKRLQACVEAQGDFTKPNPNSGAIWQYEGDNPSEFEGTMHRTMGSAAIKEDLLFIVDSSGLIHCVDAKTGKAHWTHDMLDASWGSPLIVSGHVYVGDEGGDLFIFKLSKEKELLFETNMGSSIYTSPVAAHGTLYIATKDILYALSEGTKSEPPDSDEE